MPLALVSTYRLADHAVCMAAGFRDGLRATQYYVRDLAAADGANQLPQHKSTLLSRVVARAARLTDRFMSWSQRFMIGLLLPHWRNLPSPFEPGILTQVASAIGDNSVLQTPLFNSYFFRAARHILRHDNAKHSPLVLEHRVDAARRNLSIARAAHNQPNDVSDFIARALVALVEASPIARVQSPSGTDEAACSNIRVFAIACVALMFAEDGKPQLCRDETEFFAIVDALLSTRMTSLTAALTSNDLSKLKHELQEIKALY